MWQEGEGVRSADLTVASWRAGLASLLTADATCSTGRTVEASRSGMAARSMAKGPDHR